MKRFFPEKTEVSKAMAVFLVERISNVRNKIFVSKLKIHVNNLLMENLIDSDDVREIKAI